MKKAVIVLLFLLLACLVWLMVMQFIAEHS